MKKRIFICLLVFTMLFSGCGSKKSASNTTASSGSKSSYSEDAQPGTPSSGSGTNSGSSYTPAANTSTSAGGTVDDSRKVIYNASSSIDVKDMNAAYNSIINKMGAFGGYVANSSINEDYSEVTVRVPAEKFNDFLTFLNTIGEKRSISTSTDDITEQYTDSQSKIRNLQAQEDQLLLIMKKANTIDEILKVQSELSNVRGQIEVLQGQINMWDKLLAMSTVTIRLNKVQEIGGKPVQPTHITWGEIGRGISNGFNATLNFMMRLLSGILIVIVSSVPVLPIIALVVWLSIRYFKKNNRNKNV